ncbi:MAG TPA: L-threonylcarbamoyladenylate synthase [Pirellulales bacterium]|jgi:L-threonylcarbamoyladenylate synthase|nr:L-threonylcarbamoyladenylate synthase [Pirellulales bacterium]
MLTHRLTVDPHSPEPEILARAAAVLRGGGVVAFPTETVYGLGAHALDPRAVVRIFEAKGRPAHNPLIVHVADVGEARQLAAGWPAAAERLAARFWPGPLSLVVERASIVPDVVTGGGSSVALRVPAHPVAWQLLRTSGLPLAAPSANPSTQVSATTAEHVMRHLAGRIEMVLDAGPSAGGLESTVVDVRSSPARLLRPGLVSREELEQTLGETIDWSEPQTASSAGPLLSPGMLLRHYAPRVPVDCTADDGLARVCGLSDRGLRVGWLALGQPAPGCWPSSTRTLWLPADPVLYAAGLYAALHELEASAIDRMVIALPPDTPAWHAIHDRLRRASAPAE